jgi:hypothetical protein
MLIDTMLIDGSKENEIVRHNTFFKLFRVLWGALKMYCDKRALKCNKHKDHPVRRVKCNRAAKK